MNKSLSAVCAHTWTRLVKVVSHNGLPSPSCILPSWFKSGPFQIYSHSFTVIFAGPAVSPAQCKQLCCSFYPHWAQPVQFCALAQISNARDFRKWTGSSDAMGKDFQQNHNQIWSDVKVLAGAGTGTQKLHSSCHARLIRSGRREGVHSLTACPCLWHLAQSAWRITQNWPASLWYSLYVTSVHFETHVPFGGSFHALSLLQPQETPCLPEPKRWDGWASLSLHFERSTAHFLCTGVNAFLAFNQWCTSYRGTVD